MVYPRRIQNSINGCMKRSLSAAYSRNYHYYDGKNNEKHAGEILNSSEKKSVIVNTVRLLNKTKGLKTNIVSRTEIEKDKTSVVSMVGEPAFFKDVEGELKVEVSSKMLTPST
jgi:hypothetical protein